MSDPAQTVTLSDGSVWRLVELRDKNVWGAAIPNGRYWQIVQEPSNPSRLMGQPNAQTAADHRAIADVLDPPLLPSPSEREELAKLIAMHTDLDWGAHNLTDMVDEEHESGDGAECGACLKVADAVLAKGYSKRSSPSSSEANSVMQDVRAKIVALSRYGIDAQFFGTSMTQDPRTLNKPVYIMAANPFGNYLLLPDVLRVLDEEQLAVSPSSSEPNSIQIGGYTTCSKCGHQEDMTVVVVGETVPVRVSMQPLSASPSSAGQEVR